MSPMSSSEYLDVFIQTEHVQQSLSVWIWLAAGGLFLGAVLLVLLILFRKKFETFFPAWLIAAGVVLIFSFVSVVGVCSSMFNYQGKQQEAAKHIEHNLQEKYGQDIKVVGLDLPKVEDRDKINPYLLVIPNETEKTQIHVSKVYKIRFDRETSEPFSEDLENEAQH